MNTNMGAFRLGFRTYMYLPRFISRSQITYILLGSLKSRKHVYYV